MRTIIILIVLILTASLAFAQDIPMDALVGYWSLDEGEGLVAGDSSGQGGHGELIGGAFWTEGYMGNGIELDGVSGYIDMGIGDGQFDLEFEVTLSVWVNQWEMGNGEHNPWFGKGDHTYMIKHWSGGMYEFFIQDGTNWNVCRAPIDSSHLFEWHHFVGTYDGFEAKMFIDGVPVDTLALEAPINFAEHTLALGWNSEATDRFFLGLLDEAMLFNVGLSEEQVAQLYNLESAVMHERNLANKFRLQQNYPNPFNPVTSISYTIPANLPVTLKVYDTLGKHVATVVDEHQIIGSHTVTFDASGLPSGVYFYKLQAGDILSEMKKMMVIK